MKKLLSVILTLALFCGICPTAGFGVLAAEPSVETFFADFADLAALVDGSEYASSYGLYQPTEDDTAVNAWIDARFGVFVNRESSQYKQKDFLGQSSYDVANFELFNSDSSYYGFTDRWAGPINLKISNDGALQHYTPSVGDQQIRKSHALTVKNPHGDFAELSNFEAEIVFNKANNDYMGAVYVSFHEKEPGKMLRHNNSANMQVISGNEAVIVGYIDSMTDGIIVGNVATTNTKTGYTSLGTKLSALNDYKLTVKVVGTSLTATVSKVPSGDVIYTETTTIAAGSGSLSVGLANCPRNLKTVKVTELDANGDPVDFGNKRSMQSFHWSLTDKAWYANDKYWKDNATATNYDFYHFVNLQTDSAKAIIRAVNKQFINVYNREGMTYVSNFGSSVSYEGQTDNYAYYDKAYLNRWLQFANVHTTGSEMMRHISSLVPKGHNNQALTMQNFETTFEVRMTEIDASPTTSAAIVFGFRQQEEGQFTTGWYRLSQEQAMVIISSSGYNFAGGAQILGIRPTEANAEDDMYNSVHTKFASNIAKNSILAITVRAVGDQVYLKIVNKGTDGSGDTVIAEETRTIPYTNVGSLAYGVSNMGSDIGNITLTRLDEQGEKLSLYGCVTHVYDGECDAFCNVCCEKRIVEAAHTYTDLYDSDCNICKEKRFDSRGDTGACVWTLHGTELTIEGNGAMGNYATASPAPWGTSITAVTVGEGITNVGDQAFYGCTALQTVQLPDSVTAIGACAFYGCSSLPEVTIPDDVTTIGEGAFYGCRALTSANIPHGITVINSGTFFECSSLLSIEIPDTVTSIGVGAFRYCRALTSITIPDSVIAIGTAAFGCCDAVRTLTIGNRVNSIGERAFEFCAALTTVTIPDSVTTIGVKAFYECEDLERLNLSKGVTTIGNSAFTACNTLTDVYYVGTLTDKETISISAGNDYLLNATWYYAVSCTQEHTYDHWTDAVCNVCGNTRTVNKTGDCYWKLEGTVLTIGGNGAMGDYYSDSIPPWGTGITTVIIEDGVTYIGYRAFDNCGSLTSVTIGKDVTDIANLAFNACSALTEIEIPDNVTTIGKWAFAWCTALKSVTIGNGVTVLSEGLFLNCSALTSVVFPDSVRIIEENTFRNCTSLTSMDIPESVTTIGKWAFYGCDALATVTIPESVKVIGDFAFLNSISLENIIVDEDNAYYCDIDGVLYNKEKIVLIWYPPAKAATTYTVPDGVIVISVDAFMYADLLSIYIPKTVVTIEENAFWFCYSLRHVYYGGATQNKASISLGAQNHELTQADWHYAVPQNGWYAEDSKWYRFENGCMVTNAWRKDSKGWVYLGADGAMLTNAWCKDSKGWCFVGADGYAVTSCWKKDSIGWVYLDANGSMTKSAWVYDSGKWYYCDANGYMVADKWIKDSKGWVYLGPNGAMLTNAWVRDSVGWCYVGSDGYAVTNCWKKDSKGWCYLNSEGRMATNCWVRDSKGWCYVGADGYAVTNCWKKDSIGWVYLDANGSMTKSAWVYDGGKWYYCDANGYMVANKTITIGGKNYTFNAAGICTNP